MTSGPLLLILAAGLAAQTPVPLRAIRVHHLLVLERVCLNGAGPFRMAVDTGNASSLIRLEVARRIQARAVYAVEHVTAAGVRRVPVVLLDRVTVAALAEPAVEAMIGDVALDAVDGVLGQSWLARHDYLLDYRNNLVVIDGTPPDGGFSMTLHTAGGRPSISAKVEGRETQLIVDSGASALVLFDCPPKPRLNGAALLTNGGFARSEEVTRRVALPGGRNRKMRAACVYPSDEAPGLLPGSVFSSVFVSNRDGYVRLTP